MEMTSPGKSLDSTEEERQYALYIHLSQLAGLLVPVLGLLLPLILWQVKKNGSAYIDANGKIVMNWMLSNLIYTVICGILILILIGIILLIGLQICCLVFTVKGCIKAGKGEVWPYPLSIPFFK